MIHTAHRFPRQLLNGSRQLSRVRLSAWRINRNLFIEIEVCRRSTGDKPRPTTERQVLNRPLDEDQETILECHDVHEVYDSPDDPGN